MIRLTSSALSLIILANLSFPAFANATDVQDHALRVMSPAAKMKLAALADRLEERLSSMTEEKRVQFRTKLLWLVERAENRVEKMSESRVVRKLRKMEQGLSQQGSSVLSSAVSPDVTAEEKQVAMEVGEVIENSLRGSSLQAGSNFSETEISVDRVDHALRSLRGTTAKDRILNATHQLKQELSALTAGKGANEKDSTGRKIARTGETGILMLMISPIIVGLTIGILIGSVLIPILVGVALSAVLVKLIISGIYQRLEG